MFSPGRVETPPAQRRRTGQHGHRRDKKPTGTPVRRDNSPTVISGAAWTAVISLLLSGEIGSSFGATGAWRLTAWGPMSGPGHGYGLQHRPGRDPARERVEQFRPVDRETGPLDGCGGVAA